MLSFLASTVTQRWSPLAQSEFFLSESEQLINYLFRLKVARPFCWRECHTKRLWAARNFCFSFLEKKIKVFNTKLTNSPCQRDCFFFVDQRWSKDASDTMLTVVRLHNCFKMWNLKVYFACCIDIYWHVLHLVRLLKCIPLTHTLLCRDMTLIWSSSRTFQLFFFSPSLRFWHSGWNVSPKIHWIYFTYPSAKEPNKNVWKGVAQLMKLDGAEQTFCLCFLFKADHSGFVTGPGGNSLRLSIGAWGDMKRDELPQPAWTEAKT